MDIEKRIAYFKYETLSEKKMLTLMISLLWNLLHVREHQDEHNKSNSSQWNNKKQLHHKAIQLA